MSWLELLSPTAVLACAPGAGQPEQAFVRARDLVRAAKAMLRQGYFLEDLTALDVAEGILVLYHFDHMEKPGRATLRVLVPHDSATVPSIAAVYAGAEWHERECMDFLPVEFAGNPNPSRLLLPADMAEKPLAKPDKARASLAALMQWTGLDIRDAAAPECVALAAKAAAVSGTPAKGKAKAGKGEVEA
ncbi:MAG: NADH-quinone oxidoreductase subunit C [Thermodesulfobacteriota bacterium]